MPMSNGVFPSAPEFITQLSARWAGSFATEAALQALPAGNRADNQLAFVISTGQIWKFAASTSATAAIGRIIVPDSGSGVWVAVLVVESAPWSKVVDAAAGTATAERAFVLAGNPLEEFLSFVFIPGAALAGDPANNATITIYSRNTSGGGAAVVATLTTTASWAAHARITIPITAVGAVRLSENEQLTVAISKSGDGVVVPVGCLFARSLILSTDSGL